MENSVRVLVLEDSESTTELIRRQLSRSGLPAIVERADSEHAFAAAVREFAPDVVLSDHSLAEFNAQSALEFLRQVRPTTALILVADAVNGDETVACLRAGAENLIMKQNLDRLAASITEAIELRRPIEKLTERQIEVLQMVAAGHRSKDIATRLELSVKTVESHRGEIMKRLQIHDLAGLVRYAMRVGLVAAWSA